MPNLLLPPQTANTSIVPTTAGAWEDKKGAEDAGDFLKRLSDGLNVAGNAGAIDNIDSIPDVWARPILFRMALFASAGFDKDLHKKVQGEWRAILAMLALKDVRHLNLKVEAVHLAQDSQLGQTLLDLAPNDSADGGTLSSPWNDIYVILYNDIPLAITTPTTLVAAASDYSSTLSGIITEPWSADKRHLTDPIKYLTTQELSQLHQWLDTLEKNLIQNIPQNIQSKNETYNFLLAALDNYKQAVKEKIGQNLTPTGSIIPAGRNMYIGIFKYLDYMIQAPAVVVDGKGIIDSAVRLITSPTRTKATSLLLLSVKMLEDISVAHGLPLSKIVIWPGITASAINENSLTGNKSTINGVPLVSTEWRRPEDFFTERLAIYQGGKTLKGVIMVSGSQILANQDQSIILPFKSEILEYFTPQEIAKNVSVAKEGNDIKVRFKFPISGIDGNKMDYQVEKSYPMQEVIYLVTNVPVIEIWPNFKRVGWKKYYLYYENSEAQNQSDGVGHDFLYVYPWAYDNKNIAGDTPMQGLSNLYTARLSGFPEALICTVNLTSSDGVNASPIDVGFVLLNEPDTVSAQVGKTWQIGIDFGTSSTMMYSRNGTDTPTPLVLQSNLFQVTDSGPMRNQTYKNFIPSSMKSQQAGSFLSIFQLLNGSRLKDTPPNILPLQDGNVFWLTTADKEDALDFIANFDQIDSNLKWSGDMVGQLKVAAYIKQICLQGLAEAAKQGVETVCWNFSYPTAFSALQTMTFKTTCQNAVQEISADSGFATDGIGMTPPQYWPESKASAYYFGKLGGAHFAGGAVCLDIGAGTTDISIVSGMPAKIVYHTSLQFAGRYLFKSIYDNYNIFATSLNLEGKNEEQKKSLIDADMRMNSGKYLKGLVNAVGNASIQLVLQRAQFAVAGIFYYLGGLIKLLSDKGIYEGVDIPDIYVGGNGSRIFPWICGGVFSSNNPYLTVLQEMLVKQSGLSDGFGFQIFMSNTPKIEVACGMVENSGADGAFFNQQKIAADLFEGAGKDLLIANSVFAGDAFTLRDGSSPKTDSFISAYDVSTGIKIDKIGELRNFMKQFNNSANIWGGQISISNQEFTTIGKKVQGAYAHQTGNKPENIFVEPIFILELKNFLA